MSKLIRIEKMSLSVLKKLRRKGYNILRSSDFFKVENPIFIPLKVENIWQYISMLDIAGYTPFQEPQLVIIEDALNNYSEEELVGTVWIK